MKPPIDSYRTVTHPQEFYLDWKAFYEDAYLRGQALRKKYVVEPGLRYGDDPAFLMNIFYPKRIRHGVPVFVFVHGGAFSEGHPDLYDFLGEKLLEAGVTYVSIGYRLAPTRFPDCARDVAQGLAWLARHLQAKDWTSPRFSLSGHSAGASIAAFLGVRKDIMEEAGLSDSTIDSLALFSGIYDFRPPEVSQNFVLPERREEASIFLHTLHAPRESLVVYGLPEINVKVNVPDSFKRRAELLADSLRANGHHATLLELPDADHMRTACALEDERVFGAVCDTLGVSA